jgi:hypothetical protein
MGRRFNHPGDLGVGHHFAKRANHGQGQYTIANVAQPGHQNLWISQVNYLICFHKKSSPQIAMKILSYAMNRCLPLLNQPEGASVWFWFWYFCE